MNKDILREDMLPVVEAVIFVIVELENVKRYVCCYCRAGCSPAQQRMDETTKALLSL